MSIVFIEFHEFLGFVLVDRSSVYENAKHINFIVF
jgi:hypothetical protein